MNKAGKKQRSKIILGFYCLIRFLKTRISNGEQHFSSVFSLSCLFNFSVKSKYYHAALCILLFFLNCVYLEEKDFTKTKRKPYLPKSHLLNFYPLKIIFTQENYRLKVIQIMTNLGQKFLLDCERSGLNILSSMESFLRKQITS